MEALIKTQTQGVQNHEVFELILDKWRGNSISPSEKALLESFDNLEFLSMTGCGLKDLSNFPNLKNLTTLDICDNRIKSGFEPLSNLENLSSLSLAGNPISDYTSLLPLINLPNLIGLDFYGCPLAEFPEFSKKIFEMFKNLESVNNLDKTGKEIGFSSCCDSDEDESDLEDFIEKDEESDEYTSETDENRSECEDVAQSLKREIIDLEEENKRLKTD